jgi:hypothetical protein
MKYLLLQRSGVPRMPQIPKKQVASYINQAVTTEIAMAPQAAALNASNDADSLETQEWLDALPRAGGA